MLRPQFAAATLIIASMMLGVGCRDREAERRASDQATAIAEEQAQETSLTSATIERKNDPHDAEAKEQELRANDEIVAAFRLEQADFRGRLRRALDSLDKAIAHTRQAPPRRGDNGLRDLRERRDRLKADLDAVDRSTDQDWATVRTKVDRDLNAGHR